VDDVSCLLEAGSVIFQKSPARDGMMTADDNDLKHSWEAEGDRENQASRADRMMGSQGGFLAALDAHPFPVYVADPDTWEMLYVNKALETAMGTPGSRRCYEYLQHRSAPCPFCTNCSIFDQNYGKTMVWDFQNEVTRRWYRCIDRAIVWSDGRIARCETTIDITDCIPAERERVKPDARNLQIQKAESLARMAGAMAHHYNNKLQVVIGNLELAMLNLPQNHIAAKHLAESLDAARKTVEMSGQILTYLGQVRGRREQVDLSEICRQCLPVLDGAIQGGNIILHTALASPGPVVSANGELMQKALTNLLINAVESLGEGGGFISMDVRRVSGREIPSARLFPIGWTPGDLEYACLEIRDSGCGIREEAAEKIFDPFFSSKMIGRGMGLPVAMGIVKAYQGAIAMESEPGCGSAFMVFLPVSEGLVQGKPTHR
jgi:signal transduction histidine kinase